MLYIEINRMPIKAKTILPVFETILLIICYHDFERFETV